MKSEAAMKKTPSFSIVETIIINPKINGKTVHLQFELRENKEKKIEEYIEKDDVIITLTNNGYIKRVPICTFEKQNIGGKGIIGIDINEHDSVRNTYLASTHDYILFFTNKGRVFLRRAYEIPNLTRISKGKSIVNILNLVDKELVTSLFIVNNLDSSSHLLLLTKKGYIKKILNIDVSK